jgi:hypothetical protein
MPPSRIPFQRCIAWPTRLARLASMVPPGEAWSNGRVIASQTTKAATRAKIGHPRTQPSKRVDSSRLIGPSLHFIAHPDAPGATISSPSLSSWGRGSVDHVRTARERRNQWSCAAALVSNSLPRSVGRSRKGAAQTAWSWSCSQRTPSRNSPDIRLRRPWLSPKGRSSLRELTHPRPM